MGLVRIHVRASPALVSAAENSPASGRTPQQAVEGAVGDALVTGGALRRVCLVVEDPTDAGSFSVIGEKGPSTASDYPGISILAGETLDFLPSLARAPATTLDDGLLADEARAVALALLKDNDPERLDGMGRAFAPDLPCVGALLLTRARLEHARRRGGQDHHEALGDYQAAVSSRARRKAAHARRGVGSRGGGSPLIAGGPIEQIVDALRAATADLGPAAASTWDRYGGAIALVASEEDPPTLLRDRTHDVMTVRNPVDVATVLGAALADPGLARANVSTVANLLGTDGSTTASVLSALRPLGGGVVLVDPVRARALCVGRPPPSAAAIKLAASTVRPKSQGLAEPLAIAPTFSALRLAGPHDGPTAQVDRAKRAVARRSWVTWYQAAEAGGMLGRIR